MSSQVQTLQLLGIEDYSICEHQIPLFLGLYDIWGLYSDLVVITVELTIMLIISK